MTTAFGTWLAIAAATCLVASLAQAQSATIPVPVAPAPGTPKTTLAPSVPAPAARQLVPVTQLTTPQIESLVAGVALYQDGLLSLMFLAAGFPAELEQAQLLQPTLSGELPDQAAQTIRMQNWDPAVKALLSFPGVLTMMATQHDWTRQMGDLYKFRPQALMQAIQVLRKQALQLGTLKSSPQIQVMVDNQGQVLINPVNPQLIYVPQYNPTVVYGPWAYAAYPPYPIYNPGWGPVVFGAGIAAGAVIWATPHWRTGVVVVNPVVYQPFVARYGYAGGYRGYGPRPYGAWHGGHHR